MERIWVAVYNLRYPVVQCMRFLTCTFDPPYTIQDRIIHINMCVCVCARVNAYSFVCLCVSVIYLPYETLEATACVAIPWINRQGLGVVVTAVIAGGPFTLTKQHSFVPCIQAPTRLCVCARVPNTFTLRIMRCSTATSTAPTSTLSKNDNHMLSQKPIDLIMWNFGRRWRTIVVRPNNINIPNNI